MDNNAYYRETKTKIRLLIEHTIRYERTQLEMLSDLEKIFASLPKKFPVWMRQQLRGYYEAHSEKITEKTFFGYRVNGIVYNTVKGSPRYYGKFFSTRELHENHDVSGFFWNNSHKIFSVTKNEV